MSSHPPALTPEETLMKYWGFDKLLAVAKDAHEEDTHRLELEVKCCEQEIVSLHTIMADPGLMELWLDGKHMQAHAFAAEIAAESE